MPSATVAIITRTKNRPLTLKRAMESVLGQHYQDWVQIIINDGGDPAVVEALATEYRERYRGRLHLIHHPHSQGMEAASNAGIAACDSRYVAIHDDDDSWHPEFLIKTVTYLEAQSGTIRGVLTNFDRITESLNATYITEISRESCRHWLRDLTLWEMCKGNFFPPIAFLYRRDVYDVIGGKYDASLPVLGDWEFNLRFLQYFDIGHIDDTLAYYHHRTATDTEYGNTLTSGIDKHQHYNRIIRNRLLQKDVQNGKLGIGYLLNLLHDQQTLFTHLHHIDDRTTVIRRSTEGLGKAYSCLTAPLRFCKRWLGKA